VEGSDLRLLWSPNREPDLAGYRVLRRLGDGPEQAVATVRSWEVTWVDGGVPEGADAVYRVTAFDSSPQANESGPSEPVAAGRRAPAPTRGGEEKP
jgi:hypothetical protein